MTPVAASTTMPVSSTNGASVPTPALTIHQGRIDLSFHQVVGEVIKHVLQDPRLFLDGDATSPPAPNVTVEVTSGVHPDAFAALQAAQTDILVGWFDGSHGTYIAPFRDDVVILGDARDPHEQYTPAVYNPYCVWAVPTYVPEAIVPDVTSLADPSVASRFGADESGARVLQGIAPGAGISRFSQEMITAYGLDKQGWQFRTGSQADCFGTVERRIENDEWFVVPLWHPQYLHAQYGLRALHEPKGLLRPVDDARIVLRRAFLDTLPGQHRQALLSVLRRVSLRNDAVTVMDGYVHVDKLSYRDAARKWIRAHQAQVDSWFSSTGHVDIVQRATETSKFTLPKENDTSTFTLHGIPAAAPAAAGAYLPYALTHTTTPSIIHTSFQLPWDTTVTPWKLAFVGAVGKDGVQESDALQAVRLCALNLLAQLRDAADGDLARIRLLRLEGYVATTDATVNVPRILDAASTLLSHTLGPQQGAHARTALILPTNPLNVPTMLGAVAELRW